MELLDVNKEPCRLSFNSEVKNMEFFEIIGDMDLGVYKDPKKRDAILLSIGKELFKNQSILGNEKFAKKPEESRVLSQEEINTLLTAINIRTFENIETFEKYLLERQYKPEKPYGVFDKNVAVCRFFDHTKGSENILEEIRQKNEAQGFGNIKIPNTNITLLNYSFCPKCKTIYSFHEVMDYYMNPKPDTLFKNRANQYREDTRVCCRECNAYFLPSLVLSDGTPRNEVQFLCRAQTIDAIEKYFYEKNVNVLTRNNENVIQRGNLKAIRNDVYLKDLEERQTLVSNMLQHTPINLMMNLIDGTNVEKGDIVFNQWK
jgi:hypothetical protein